MAKPPKVTRPRKAPEGQYFRLDLPAEIRYLGLLREFIAPIAQAAGFVPREIVKLKLILEEAGSNIMRHAYPQSSQGPLQLEVWRRGRELEMVMTDYGRGFDWDRRPEPDLKQYVEKEKKGGLGIWFIRKLSDCAEYHAGPQGNHLRLIKRSTRRTVKNSRG